MTRVIAIASGGGHWQQMLEMRPAYEDCDVLYLTTLDGLPQQAGLERFDIIRDCNRNEPVNVARTAARLMRIIRREKPDVILSTGALPGVMALGIGKLFGARTIWVDSVANAEELSMSGKLARRVADLWLSQWPDVAKQSGADYAGSIL
ncbi:UDP-N-acetylglucosamine--LPS N-acetylglucosamine transferase [Paracoccaceae bacterium GXU_MW_L88]